MKLEHAAPDEAVPDDLFALWEVARKCIQCMERLAYGAQVDKEDESFAEMLLNELHDLHGVVMGGIPLFNQSIEELDPETPEPIKVGARWYTSAHHAALNIAHDLLNRAGNPPSDDPQVMLERAGAIRAMILKQDVDYLWLLTKCSMEVTAAARRRRADERNRKTQRKQVSPNDSRAKPKKPKKRRSPKKEKQLSGMASAPDLAERFDIPLPALTKRLQRFRHNNANGWHEVSSDARTQRSARWVYQVAAVLSTIRDLQKSVERRLRKKP